MSDSSFLPKTPLLRSKADWPRWIPGIRAASGKYWHYWDPYVQPQTLPSARPGQNGDYDKTAASVQCTISETVSPSIRMRLNDLPDKNLAIWMAYLLKDYGEDQAAREAAEQAYLDTLKQYNPVKMEQWLGKWLTALFEADRLNVPKVKDGQWLSDLSALLSLIESPVAADAAATFRAGNSEVLQPIYSRSWAAAVLAERRQAVTKRSLNLSRLVEQSALGAPGAEGNQKPIGATRESNITACTSTTRKNKKNQRQRLEDLDECEACLRKGHIWRNCFGLFEEKATRNNRGMLHTKKIISMNLARNPDLRRKVDEARRAAGSVAQGSVAQGTGEP